ncbi:MAG: GlsB/YeaQ/YmgE family stress response membrane protein [Verrucomicrobiota bacterium]
MGILSWIVLGLVAGALAKWIMPGKQGGGCLLTMGLGIVGAMVGGFISQALGYGTVTEFDFAGVAIAVGGALVVLFVFGLITGKK